jgi:hypothetical protein
MKRSLYRCLLWLHPPAFRQRFAEEMLWIFDETANTGATRLLADGLVSLFRQWVVRLGVWRPLAAGAGAAMTLVAGLALQPLLRRGLKAIQADSPQRFFALAALATLVAVSLTLTLCVLWFRFSVRRRGWTVPAPRERAN